MKRPKTLNQLLKENENLRIRLQEAEDTLKAIQEGAVDAIVVKGRRGEKIFTLSGEDQIYRRLVETMGEAGLTTTPEGKILFCNQQFSEMLGLPMEEIVGRDLEEFVKKSDLKAMAALLIKAQIEPTRKRLVFLAANGSHVPAWVSANLLEHDDMISICLVAMDQTELEASKEAMHQIGEQREQLQAQREELQSQNEELQSQHEELYSRNDELLRSETKLHRQNRTLRALSNSNQAMMHAADERKYLKEVCKIIVKDCGYAMAWIGFVEDDKEKMVTPAAYSGLDRDYLEALKLTWSDAEQGQDPTGTAIRTGEVCLCSNMLTDPHFKPWRAEAIKRGYASLIALPLMDGPKAFGALAIYSKESDPFSEDEVGLLTELANDLAFGITSLRSRVARQQAEEALRKSQKTFSELVELAPFGIYIIDSQFRIAHMNVSSQNGAFRNVRPVIGRAFNEAMHILWPDDVAEEIIAHFRHTLDTGKPYYSPRFTHPRDDVKIVESYEWELHRMILADGQYGVICYYFDSTALRNAEEALRESRNQIQSIIDNTPALVYMLDLDERFLLVNKALAELLNSSPERMIGKRRHEFMPKADADRHEANDRKAIDWGIAMEFEEYSQLEGRSITWLTTKFPLRDAQGKIYAVAGISSDISERKQAEERLKALTEELKRSNTDLQQFAYTASHDLKEPLRTISGFVGFLEQKYKGNLDEKANEYIQFITNGVKRMDNLLSGLLQYSRVQTKGQPPAPVPAHTAFNAAVSNLRASITEADALVTSDMLPVIKFDGTQLVQLFQNLIGNAVKFRGEQRPEIHVGCDKQDKGWLFFVRDNGIGIAPDAYERIFLIFQQLHRGEKYSGSGLGLAICKKIVERHGGKIWVESQLGKGTTIFFALPD